jgi:hypothetical protein
MDLVADQSAEDRQQSVVFEFKIIFTTADTSLAILPPGWLAFRHHQIFASPQVVRPLRGRAAMRRGRIASLPFS